MCPDRAAELSATSKSHAKSAVAASTEADRGAPIYEERRDVEIWGGSRLRRIAYWTLVGSATLTFFGGLFGLTLGLWPMNLFKAPFNMVMIAQAVPLVLLGLGKKRPGVLVRADQRGVSLDGTLFLDRDEIARGGYHPGKRTVELRGPRGRRVAVQVESAQEARSLLRAADEDATQVVYETSANLPGRQAVIAATALILGLMMFGGASVGSALAPKVAAALLATVMMIVSVFWIVRGTRIRIGADGIAVGRGRQERFFPYSEVTAEPTATGIRLTVKGNEVIDLDFRNKNVLREDRDVVLARIADVRAARTAGAALDAAALLTRGDRPANEWLRELRSISVGRTDYRRLAIDRETLLGIVEDGSRAAEQRAAAAIALGESPADGEVERLRRAAATSASPRLRIAVDATLHGDEAAMLEALEALEPEAEARQAATAGARPNGG